MRKLIYKKQTFNCLANETVLETLLRHNINIPYSCGIGICQSCLLKSSSSTIPKQAQAGLKKSLIEQHYFLPCVCSPNFDFEIIQSKEHEIFLNSTVLHKQWLANDICQFILEKPKALQFHPGQSINIRNKNSLTRSYSIANSQQSRNIELHVKYLQNGQMSNWLCKELKVGDSLELQGANGNSYYDIDSTKKNILLIGTGTGLAPLLGIVREALANNHLGEIHIYHGSRYSDGLYLIDSMHDLENQYSNIHYYPCVSSSNRILDSKINIPGYVNKRADVLALENHSSLKNWIIYLSGHAQMVKDAKTRIYLSGASLSDIYTDPFELKDLRKTVR